jgi:histidinol-phosphate aminotransferase
MSFSRRRFLRGLSGGAAASPALAALVAARGFEELSAAWTGGPVPTLAAPAVDEIRIGGNENPLGPGKVALDALLGELDQSKRYPFNSRVGNRELLATLARIHDGKPENFVLGPGSSEILRNSVRVFCSEGSHLVTGVPSYSSPAAQAAKSGFEAIQVPLDDELRLDLDEMAGAAQGAGMIYLCNPNNPTATIHPAWVIESFITELHAIAPDALVLVDEAYHDYVTDPAHETMIPLAMSKKNVVVARTFSKAYGMAGLRLGFGCGHPDTIAKLRRYSISANANVLAIAAGVASLDDPVHIEDERARNTKVKQFTIDFFERAGYESTDSQTNFLFVDLRRPAKEFRDACAQEKVFVGRDFPPMEKTHCRISIGTMDEMKRATAVFAKVLNVGSSNDAGDAAAGGAP